MPAERTGPGDGPEDDALSGTLTLGSGRRTPIPLDATLPADASDAPTPPPRSTLGRYRLLSRLGAGAMGVVWEARDPNLDRRIAIKVLAPNIAQAEGAAERLLREAKAMAKVSHRAVVAVHDAGELDGELFIAMELVEGASLGKLLAERPGPARKDWRRWLDIMLEAGRGLAAAHDAGITHRDFKPDNILIAKTGQVRVGDFGVAQLPAQLASRMSSSDISPTLTQAGALVGTPAYMSPEQLRGDPSDARSDQFGYCVTLYQALFGSHPFGLESSATLATLLTAIEAGRITVPPRDTPVPRRVREAIERGLSADPAKRFPSMHALLAALAPRGRTHAIYAGAAVILLAALGLATYALTREQRDYTAVALFPTSMRTGLAIDPDGTRVALATMGQLDIRDLDGGGHHRFPGPTTGSIGHVEMVDTDHAIVAAGQQVYDWNLATDAVSLRATMKDGAYSWLGTIAGGDAIMRAHTHNGYGYEVYARLADGERVIATGAHRLELFAVSPDKTRIAYADSGIYAGTLVVAEVATGSELARSPSIVELTGVTWKDADHLLYSTGLSERPTIWEASITDLARPVPRYREAHGWFGQIAQGGGRMLFIYNKNNFRAKLLSRTGSTDLEPELVGATVAWTDDSRPITWNRHDAVLELDGVQMGRGIDGEPGNATRAGDLVIVAMRKPGGRELTAVSIASKQVVWHEPVGYAAFVRCAGDARPPCVAVVEHDDERAELRRFDPVTGELGATLRHGTGAINDAAVSGNEVVVSDGKLTRISLDDGRVLGEMSKAPLDAARTVAFRGDHLIVAGTEGVSRYAMFELGDDGPRELLRSPRELLFLPRPSPDGDKLFVMGRVFEPELYELK